MSEQFVDSEMTGRGDFSAHAPVASPDQASLSEGDDLIERSLVELQKYWGYGSYRPLQREAVTAVLERRDSLVVLPTGGGKSLCYQVPALLRDGMAVVVSPLIALMKDQVDALSELGISAAAVNSSLSGEERHEIARRVRAGEIQILYVAPERLCTPKMLDFLADQQLSFLAVDEAHCISSWGHQFRPEYRLLGTLRDRFPNLDLHAYTATATQQVRSDIEAQLGLRQPEVLVGQFDRPNLTYRVVPRQDVRAQVRDVLDRFSGQAGIIYCISRKQVDELNSYLKHSGYRSAAYHAGLDHNERQAAQDDFLNERVNIIVATVAFGMGIDKPNVRFVIHASATKSIENYQQETGRAGRDGLPSECHLFHGGQDFATWKLLLSDLTGDAKQVADEQLKRKQQFCHSLTCRHRALVEHFGQEYDKDNCGACDVCLDELKPIDDSLVVSQKILSCVVRVEQRFGAEYVANVLLGSREQRLLNNGHDQLSTYGLMKTYSKKAIRSWIDQLEAQGCLERDPEHSSLAITPTGRKVFKADYVPGLLEAAKQKKSSSKPSVAQLSEQETELFELLRGLRRELAEAKKIAPFIVCGDVTLIDLCSRRPTTLAGLLQIQGIGAKKADEYGPRLLAAIVAFCEQNKLPTDLQLDVHSSDSGGEATQSVASQTQAATQTASSIEATEYFDDQLSIAEVAEKMGRAPSTVSKYLTEYLQHTGRTTAEPWVDEETFQKVSLAALESDSDRLKPIYEALDGEVSYDQIRFVVTCMKNAGEAD